jgi:histidinol-phosphate/aromatic aminotransferase/cobyric acid decarboxylase-like protein
MSNDQGVHLSDEEFAGASTLTEQELAAAQRAVHDLGPGYPLISLPGWCVNFANDKAIALASLEFPPAWSSVKSRNVEDELSRSVRDLLCIRDDAVSMHATFSGSVALDRAMTAIVLFARERGCRSVHVITTSPCIDIMKLFLSERVEIEPIFVPSDANGDFPYGLNGDGICRALECSRTHNPTGLQVVLLTSPENPTGEMWTGAQLSQIAARCAEHHALLVVDHCFLLAGVQAERPAAVWDIALGDLDWIGVWDTGKTIGMNEEKLGFLIVGGPHLSRFAEQSVNTIQFGVSRRQKLVFSAILSDRRFGAYLGQLRSICLHNVETLQELIVRDPRISVRLPKAGSMVLLNCSRVGVGDEVLRRLLLDAEVGVISGRVFFHSDPVPTDYIRLALARDPDYFRGSIIRLLHVLKSI